jgi:predicted cupin superfamily sugar epimerase
MEQIEKLVSAFNLLPHPEGGFYAETYRSTEAISGKNLPERFSGDRSFSTAIYFLLPAGNFSAFHRIQSDECWHFYEGGSLNVYVIHTSGELQIIRLGKDIANGETYQAVVPAGCWFASRPANGTEYALVGCTVAPGFDFADFELAYADKLIADFPQHETVIRELCRQ